MKNAYNAVKCSVNWKKVYVSKPLVVVILKCNQKLVGVKSSVCKFFFLLVEMFLLTFCISDKVCGS